MDDPFLLAPSELDYKPVKCTRCYYLEKIKKIKLMNFPPPVFSNFDVVQQAYFKDKNTSALTSHLPPGRIMQKEEMPGRVVSTTLKDNKGREFILGGRPDVVIEFDDKSYGIIDFKTTNIKSDKAESYRYQLEAYRYIFSYPGSIKKGPTPKLSPITHMGVLQFEPKSISDNKENNCSLNLEMSYSKLEQNDKKFFTRIEMILDILELKDPPPINENCTDCMFAQNQLN
jgi:hypothetical protein